MNFGPIEIKVPHEQRPLPFLKWAGGKRWLVSKLGDVVPSFTGRYFEPFLGGGALFFAMRPKEAILSDLNSELIDTYNAIKVDWRSVWEQLEWHQNRHSKRHYYEQRELNEGDTHTKAARFIYLNRACWNGLYRVNLKGMFNVPKGTKDSIIFDDDNFSLISSTLRNVSLKTSDFESVIEEAKFGDFVFLDPPYTVKHNNNGFNKYNEKLFSWNDQIRLRDGAVRAADRGAFVLMTNANHRSIRDLYRPFATFHSVKRASVLSANSIYRGIVTELLIEISTSAMNSTQLITRANGNRRAAGRRPAKTSRASEPACET